MKLDIILSLRIWKLLCSPLNKYFTSSIFFCRQLSWRPEEEKQMYVKLYEWARKHCCQIPCRASDHAMSQIMRSWRCCPVSHICSVVTVGIQFLSFGWAKPLQNYTIQPQILRSVLHKFGRGKVVKTFWNGGKTGQEGGRHTLLSHCKLALKDFGT